MPIRFANPAPKRTPITAAQRRKRSAIRASMASKAQRQSLRLSEAAFAQRERRRKKKRKNTSSSVRSTRGVRTLPARPTGVPRPRPGSKPPGVPNPRRRRRSSMKDWGAYGARSRLPRTAAKRNAASPRRRKKMARKKLYGAAATAHARKRAKSKRRGARRRRKSSSSTAPRRRRRKARSSTPRRRRRKKVAAATAPRRRRRRRKSVTASALRTYRRGSRKRRRKIVHSFGGAPRARRRRRRRVAHSRQWGSALRAYGARRSNPSRGRRRRRYRRNPRPSTQRSMLRARRAIRNRYKTPLGRATVRRYRMRSNPGGVLIDTLKAAVPVAISLYGARALSFGLSSRVPGLNRVPSQFQGTVMALALGAVGHFATKKVAKLQKYRGSIMLGLGLNLIDNLLAAFAPSSVKARIGLGDVYADGLGDYVQVDGAPPIDDNMTLSDYIEVGDYVEVGAEEELGASVEEELGLEEELGADAYLGGVQQSSMLAPIARVPSLQAVPQRSFTKEVPRAGAGYDNPKNLYGGVFAGGFGG